ncbi:MAG TPA: IS110 family transposase [Micromonospora sp.]|nr:IS110 family transposase [Micromonospora sp.]
MPMLADVVDAVIGVDTHTQTHTLAVCAPTGAVLHQVTIPATDDGHAHALDLAIAAGGRVVFAIEGTRSHGIGLARAVQGAGLDVVEVEQPARKARRGKGKSDDIDAVLAARNALGYDVDKLPTPRADGTREALRILLVARRDITDERTAKINMLKALLRTGTPADAALAAGTMTKPRLAAIARRRGTPADDNAAAARRAETRRLAMRIAELDRQKRDNDKQLRQLVTDLAPGLLDRRGIGPVNAAQAIVAWSHPGRCRSEAAFAALAGVNPIPASSGLHQRHRLNRGGDRQLNRALHNIAMTRMRACERTRDYVTRRRAEGKNDREIRRCLKRYIARDLYRTLNREITT